MKYQFINWFPKWQGISWGKFKGGLSVVYDWSICFGFWELRRWCKNLEKAVKRYNDYLELKGSKLKPCDHDWGLYSGYLIVTSPGVREFKYICFKCQEIKTIQKEYVRGDDRRT